MVRFLSCSSLLARHSFGPPCPCPTFNVFGEATISSAGINVPGNSVTIIELDANPPVEPQQIFGCTDISALNYQNNATDDDGSCSYPVDNQDNNTDSQVNNSNNDSGIEDNTNTTQNGNQTDLLVKDCTICCGQAIQIPINEPCPIPDCQPCDEQSVDSKSTSGEFVRSVLAVAVFAGLVILLFVSRKK